MLEVYELEQGSDLWKECRLGVCTASNFASVLAKGKGLTRRSYLLKLAGERITGVLAESYSNPHMERGIEQEAAARTLYVDATFNDVIGCGFMRDQNIGYSPDGLINHDGLLEVKSKLAHLQAEVLLSDEVPSEHVAQIQGGLLVSGRKWLDFVSYCPGMPLFIKRVERDEKYIAILKEELAKFEAELCEIVQKIQGMKNGSERTAQSELIATHGAIGNDALEGC